MRYFLVLAAVIMTGCSVPGVGELEERVDELESEADFDAGELEARIDELAERLETLDRRVSAPVTTEALETGEERMVEPRTLSMEDITGLTDSLDAVRTGFEESVARLDTTATELASALDSVSMENDSLRAELDELQETVQNLSYTVSNLRTSGTSSGSSRGGTSSSGTGSSRGGSSSSSTGSSGSR